jgi:WD40 repeat protein
MKLKHVKKVQKSLFILGFSLVTLAANQLAVVGGNQIIQNSEIQVNNNHEKSNKSNVILSLINTISSNDNTITQLKINNDIVLAAYDSRVIKLFNLQNSDLIKSFNTNGIVKSLAISSDNKFMAYSLQDTNIIRIIKLSNGQIVNTIRTRQNVENIAIFPNGKILIGTDKNGVYRWDLQKGIRIGTFAQSSLIDMIAISPNGKNLVGVGQNSNSSGYNSFVRIWDLNTGKIVHTITPKSSLFIKSIAVSSDSSKIALGWAGSDHVNALNIWDISSGRLTKDIGINAKPFIRVPEINSVVFSKDGKYLFTGSSSNDETNILPITLWDLTADSIVGDFEAHQSYVSRLSLSVNGKFLVSSGGDNTIKIWQVETK